MPTLKACPATFTDVIFSNNVQLEEEEKKKTTQSRECTLVQACSSVPENPPQNLCHRNNIFNTHY